MNREFTPYGRALKLKQLGFDEPCLAWHNSERLFLENHDVMNNEMSRNYCCVLPTFSQAFRWFREKYNIDFTIITNYAKIDSKTIKSYRVGIVLVEGKKINSFFLRPKKDSFEFLEFKTYEEAELACLDEMIKIVELKQQEP
jgi:hypothetical protein